ncbi:hypothetical protein CLLI_08790 [Clostridium liquoris]|jgi:four helix bundle protein|uniref:Four helix bundle protein n=1 Tax=Clostridium liquoris TaxID=1289519 RepID=A0A2T0B681_9CLOT|nr:four helix bundle protein [Clostridium liquoris]PRR79399.1 hypothetical protein CLLI_08790 [Clostridium liquoris]
MNVALDKSYKFSINIVNLYKYLCSNKKEYVMSKQLLRAGTSIGANIREGLYGQSRKDFLSKMSISLKEAAETEYWLSLLKDCNYLDSKKALQLLGECEELIKILVSTINTTKERMDLHKE